MRVVVEGEDLKRYRSPVEGQIFVPAQYGKYWEIHITNTHSHKRVRVHVSVDGRSVMDAKPAAPRQLKGYVLTPGETTKILGWRTSLVDVMGFKFSDIKNSYVNKIGGNTNNTGIIGVEVCMEAPEPEPVYPRYPTGSLRDKYVETLRKQSVSTARLQMMDESLRSAEASPQSMGMGATKRFAATDAGELVTSKVTEVSFREGEYVGTLELRYEFPEVLKTDYGIDIEKDAPMRDPEAFPGCEDACPFPPGYDPKRK